jgi:hypothetical protein
VLGAVRHMSEYAVAWKHTADPFSLYVGGLIVHATGVRLRGSAGYAPVVREFTREEIDAVERVRTEDRLGGFPSLRVSLKGGQSLLIASVTGTLGLSDLIDALTTLIT